MNTALPDEAMKPCAGHGRMTPLHRFRPMHPKGCVGRSDSHSCLISGHYARRCRQCEGMDRNQQREAVQRDADNPEALAFWRRVAARRLRQHLSKWSKRRIIRDRWGRKVEVRAFIPAFADLPPAKRTEAQIEWLAKRRGTTVDLVADLLYRAYRDGVCPGRCRTRFRDYPPEDMQLAVRNPMLPPTIDNLFAFCRMENQQMGTMAWADLVDKWFWDDECRDGRETMPVQQEMFV